MGFSDLKNKAVSTALKNYQQVKQKAQEKSVSNGLSDLFKVHIRECDRTGAIVDGGLSLDCFALDGQLSSESNWNSPFESATAENRMSNVLGMLQSGEAGQLVQALGLSEEGSNLDNALDEMEGRTSFTKVNSTLVFTSTQSMQLQMTLFFRAWKDALAEVENPLKILQLMSVPKMLSTKTAMTKVAEKVTGNGDEEAENPNGWAGATIDTVFPSQSPCFVAVTYSGKTYAPMVVQSFSRPVTGQINGNGHLLYAEVSVTFASRQAWDRSDVTRVFG